MPLKGTTVGILRQTLGQGVAPEVSDTVEAAAEKLRLLGAAVQDVHLPAFDVGLPAYYVIALSEASSNLSRWELVFFFCFFFFCC